MNRNQFFAVLSTIFRGLRSPLAYGFTLLFTTVVANQFTQMGKIREFEGELLIERKAIYREVVDLMSKRWYSTERLCLNRVRDLTPKMVTDHIDRTVSWSASRFSFAGKIDAFFNAEVRKALEDVSQGFAQSAFSAADMDYVFRLKKRAEAKDVALADVPGNLTTASERCAASTRLGDQITSFSKLSNAVIRGQIDRLNRYQWWPGL
jgi:hypothetical protein